MHTERMLFRKNGCCAQCTVPGTAHMKVFQWTIFMLPHHYSRGWRHFVFRLSIHPPVCSIQYFRNTLRECFQIWHNCPLGPNNKLIGFWWWQVIDQGHCSFTLNMYLLKEADGAAQNTRHQQSLSASKQVGGLRTIKKSVKKKMA